MRKVKVCYFNNRNENVYAYVNTFYEDAVKVFPNEFKQFEVKLESNQELYIKEWGVPSNVIFLSGVDKKSLKK